MLVSSLLVAGCANHSAATTELPKSSQAASERSDPLERFNRAMWRFNYDIVDPLVIRPLAVVWRDYFPRPARQIVRNVLSNLNEPVTSVNYLLQAQFSPAFHHLARFLINTVAGLGGAVDIAALIGLLKGSDYRFGDVLGYYRVGHGPYMMLPGYGPTTPRQLIGRIPEYYYFPISCLPLWGHVGKWLLEGIETRAGLLSKENLLYSSSDDYLTFREAYFQWRDFIVEESRGPQDRAPTHSEPQLDLNEFD